MKLTIKYFASLREQAKKSEEVLDVDLNSPRDIYNFLCDKYGFSLAAEKLKVSINNEYSSMESALNENDTLVFIPPVAGG